MPIGFLLGQLSRERIDLEKDALAFEAVIRRLRSHMLQEGLLTDSVCHSITAVEGAARGLLRIQFERKVTAEELEELHTAITALRHALLKCA